MDCVWCILLYPDLLRRLPTMIHITVAATFALCHCVCPPHVILVLCQHEQGVYQGKTTPEGLKLAQVRFRLP